MKTNTVVCVLLALALLWPALSVNASGFLMDEEEPAPRVVKKTSRQQRTNYLEDAPAAKPAAPVRRAERTSYLESETEAEARETCKTCRVAAVTSNQAAREVNYAYSLSFRNYRGKPIGPACRKLFMNSTGEYGAAGNQISRLVNSSTYRHLFMDNTSLSAVCPRFRTFSPAQKTRAWIWFWMVLANEEATCNPYEPHATHLPDGRRLNPEEGYGLFAAELDSDSRYVRGPMCRGNIRQMSTQLNCAIHTMADRQLDYGSGVLTGRSYWGPIRRASVQIMPNMRGFKPCFQR